jgi:tetratricopeptide (TPR) repeat protein
VALAPEFGAAHLALGTALLRSLEFVKAAPEFEHALALAPGSSRVQHVYALYAAALGHFDPAVDAARRAVSLDPQNWWAHYSLAGVYVMARRFREAQTALQSAQALNPASFPIGAVLVDVLLASGQIQLPQQKCESSATPLSEGGRRYCLALVYHAQGRQADAERELKQFAMVSYGGGAATWRVAIPEKHLIVIVLTNLQDSGPEELALGVAALYEPSIVQQ